MQITSPGFSAQRIPALADILFLLAFAVLAFIGATEIQREYAIYTTRDLYFGFGDVIHHLINDGIFKSREVILATPYVDTFYAHRFPLIPGFYYALGFFTENYIIAAMVKNVALAYVTYWILHHVAGLSVIRCAVFFILVLLLTSAGIQSLDYEEGYSPFFMLWLLIALQKRLFVLFLTSLALLLALKSAYWLPSSLLVLVLCFLPVWNRRQKWLMVLVFAGFSISWATWTYEKAGFIATPLNASTFDGFNLLKGVNPVSNTVHPVFQIDTVDELVLQTYANPALKTEHEINQWFKGKAIAIMLENPPAQVQRVWNNLKVIATSPHWGDENAVLRQSTLASLAANYLKELGKIPQNRYVLAMFAVVMIIQYAIFFGACRYLARSSCLLLLPVPFLFCWANFIIFADPRHFYLITVPLCYWCLAGYSHRPEKQAL